MKTKTSSSSNNILLPKKHLSWSQMQIWQSNPERYKREYFENGQKLDTKYLQFGKSIAKAIENEEYRDILPSLEVYEASEYEIRVKVADVPILSYIDSYSPEMNVFREYKTGKNPWTQAKVQKHDQLTFYATALKWKHGKMPKHCHLDWIETSEWKPEKQEKECDFWSVAEKKLSCTGRIVSFKRTFDKREIERMEKLIYQTAVEISDAYKLWISEI